MGRKGLECGVAQESRNRPGYREGTAWSLGFSAYWFATSYKWFILLFILLPDKVGAIVPGGEKNTAWGLVFGTGAVWALVGPSIFGRLSETLGERWRRRGPWLVVGSALTCVALGFVYGAGSLPLLGLGYLLLQVSDDIGTGPYAGMVADSVPPERRGFHAAVLGGMKLGGQIVSALMAIALREPGLIFIAIGGVNLVCALVTAWTIREVPARPEPVGRSGFVAEYLEPFKSPDFRYVWANRFIVAFAFACVTAYTLNFLKDMFTSWRLFGWDLGEPATAANVLALTISFTGVMGAVFAARVSDRVGRKPLLIFGAIVFTCALVPIAIVRDFTAVWICVVFFGVANGMYQSADWAIASDVLPNTDKAATEMGAWQSSETAVQVPAGVVMGFLVDQLNRVSFGLGYQAMVLTSAALFLVSIALVRRIRSAR